MKIQYASDLHLEMMFNRGWLARHELKPSANILVLAGDVSYLGNKSIEDDQHITWLSDNFKQVLIVPGNHEYYGGFKLDETLDNFEWELRPNVRYLNNKSVVIDDTEFFLTTLWSKIPSSHIADIQYGLNDFRLICYKNDFRYAGDLNEIHYICLNWLDGALKASTAKHKVVVSHHCPTMNPAFNNYPGSKLNPGFMSDNDNFIASHDIDAWIFGHTHYNAGSGTVIGGTPLLTNQLGYVSTDEEKTFDPSKTLTLD